MLKLRDNIKSTDVRPRFWHETWREDVSRCTVADNVKESTKGQQKAQSHCFDH